LADEDVMMEVEQQARAALEMANRLAAPAKREEARLRLTCAALTGLCAFGGLRESTPHNAVRQADLCLALLYPKVDP
jgi:hypothetical protein